MKWKKIVLPLLVFIGCLGISLLIFQSTEKPERRTRKEPVTTVDVKRLKRQDFQITILTQGTVKPRTESTLIPEVAGRIIKTSPQFREGAFFEVGAELLRIENSNYQIAVTVAKANLSEAKLAFAEENALAEQAARNWQRLGNTTPPTDLVLHKPQLARANASVASAEALLKQAQLDLKRTRVIAPYAGRVLEQPVDIGQYVSPGTVLAKIYAVDYAEIRLPLSNRQLEFVDIPENYRGETESPDQNTEVTLTVNFGNQKYQWMGTIVRAEGTYDVRSRRLFVVAQVDNPYGQQDPKKPPLKVGQYVEAQIKGRLLDKVFVIPRSAVRENSQILLIDKQNKIQTLRIKAIWEDGQTMVISEGIEEGELLCLTPITFAAQGITVKPLLDGKPLFSNDMGKANKKLKTSSRKDP
jgi:RND family efflux transporter MFP subunit